jgi:hypothetical protein
MACRFLGAEVDPLGVNVSGPGSQRLGRGADQLKPARRSPWSERALPAASPDLLEQVDQPVDVLGAGRHQPQTLDQALDVRVVQGDALYELAVHLELDRRPACHGPSRPGRKV